MTARGPRRINDSADSIIAAALSGFLSTAPAFAQDWIEYSNQKDFFSITIPGQLCGKLHTKLNMRSHYRRAFIPMKAEGTGTRSPSSTTRTPNESTQTWSRAARLPAATATVATTEQTVTCAERSFMRHGI